MRAVGRVECCGERVCVCARVRCCVHARQTKSQFKARSVANNVEIYIPVPPDVDSPSFKVSPCMNEGCDGPMLGGFLVMVWGWLVAWLAGFGQASLGTVTYVPDLDCIKWTIKQFYGQRECLMRAHFGLPSVSGGTLDCSLC